MPFLSNDRGVSEVLGAILVFALVLAVLVIIQVAGVPAANEKIEFEHNTRVQADFQEFDQNVDRAAALGAESSSAVETGVRYPPRLFLINPGPSAGTIESSQPSSVGFSNVAAINTETDEFFQTPGALSFETVSLRYSPSYNEYNSAPATTYEHGVIYNSDQNGVAVIDNGNLISGNRISLVVLNGSISESSTKSVTVNTKPKSGAAQTVSITNSSAGNPVTFTLPTALTQDDWWDDTNKTGILAEEMTENGGYVESVSVASNTVTITLTEGVTYDLRLAKVGIGSGSVDEDAYYMKDVEGSNIAINADSTGEMAVQIRDRFNNPVSGIDVNFRSPDGEFNSGTNGYVHVESDEDGIARAVFKPDSSFTGTAKVTAEPVSGTLPGDKNAVLDDYEKVEFSGVTVNNATKAISTSSGLEQINSRQMDIFLTNSSIDGDTLEVTFKNVGDNSWTFSEVRMPFVLGTNDASWAKIDETAPSSNELHPQVYVGDNFTSINSLTIPSKDTVEVKFTFNEKLEQSGGQPFDGAVIFSVYMTQGASSNFQTFFLSDGYTLPAGPAGNAPSISNFEVFASGQDVDVSFDSDEQLSTISVALSGDASGTLTESDFTESGSGGAYTYTADVSVGQDGTFTATLNTAEDSSGNDGASGQSDSVTVGSGGGGNNQPTIQSFTTTGSSSGNNAYIDVEWSVEDSEGWNSGANINVRIVLQDDPSTEVYNQDFTPAGNPYSDSTGDISLTKNVDYRVYLTVDDGDGGQATSDKVQQAK